MNDLTARRHLVSHLLIWSVFAYWKICGCNEPEKANNCMCKYKKSYIFFRIIVCSLNCHNLSDYERAFYTFEDIVRKYRFILEKYDVYAYPYEFGELMKIKPEIKVFIRI